MRQGNLKHPRDNDCPNTIKGQSYHLRLWTGALECTWPAQLPLSTRFRDAMPFSTAPPTLLRARSLPYRPGTHLDS